MVVGTFVAVLQARTLLRSCKSSISSNAQIGGGSGGIRRPPGTNVIYSSLRSLCCDFESDRTALNCRTFGVIVTLLRAHPTQLPNQSCTAKKSRKIKDIVDDKERSRITITSRRWCLLRSVRPRSSTRQETTVFMLARKFKKCINNIWAFRRI